MGKSLREKGEDSGQGPVGRRDAASATLGHEQQSGQTTVTRRRIHVTYYLAGSVSLVTLAVYLYALQNEFVDWDDGDYVCNNPFIRSFNGAFFRWAFLDFYAANWHPLTWISHAIDYAVWGLNPLGHHLTNNILHAVNTFLVVLLVVRLVASQQADKLTDFHDTPLMSHFSRVTLIAAGTTGLLFGLHPLHVESVAWVAERKDLLCGLFYLLSVLAYVRYARAMSLVNSSFSLPGVKGTGHSVRGTMQSALAVTSPPYVPGPLPSYKGALFSALCFFIFALLSKPMAVSLPVVLLILDWYPFKRIRSVETCVTVLIEKLPFAALSLGSAILTVLAQRADNALALMEAVPFTPRILLASRSLVYYLWEMIWPVNLVPYYPYPRTIDLLSLTYLLPLGLVIGITTVCVVVAKPYRLWLSVWSFYVVTLLPVLGIVQAGGQSMADRYTYLPSLGPFLIVGLVSAWVWVKVTALRKWGPMVPLLSAVLALCIFAAMGYLTINQIGIWKNSIELWSAVIEKEPTNSFAYFKRGAAFFKMGRPDKAIADYNRSVALAPFHFEAFYGRGLALSRIGQFNEAIKDYTTALYIKPKYADAYNQRGLTYSYAGQYGKALEDISKAIELNPMNADAYINRGNLYLSAGSRGLAMSDFQKACDLGSRGGCYALESSGKENIQEEK